jgi:hypothetical protein
MASPVGIGYSVDSGGSVNAGRRYEPTFNSVAMVSEDAGIPYTTANQTLLISMHGSSGGGNLMGSGRQFRAQCSGALAYGPHTEFIFSTARITTTTMSIRPVDYQLVSGVNREAMWLGFSNVPAVTGIPGAKARFFKLRRLEAMYLWASSSTNGVPNVPNVNWKKTCVTGGSMGGWGTMTLGVRRPEWFAALYPDRPRWKHGSVTGKIWVAPYTGSFISVDLAAAPTLSSDDGGGLSSTFMNLVDYVANTANKIPWIGWNCGRNDGFALWQDQLDGVAAMRAAKRGFAFAWNNGDHTVGSIPSQITASYPLGTFEIGKGYPLFTEHSLDNDPTVDLVGGINLNLSFRNVVETASSWSCEVTSIAAACTVKVEPISDVFKTAVTAKLVTIPAANTWVAVSFPV